MALGGVHVTTHAIWHARAVALRVAAIKTTCQAHVLVGGRLGYSREGGIKREGEEEHVNAEGEWDRGPERPSQAACWVAQEELHTRATVTWATSTFARVCRGIRFGLLLRPPGENIKGL